MKIGLFFGSFNPVHIGHLIIANYILNELAVEQIWFIVSPLNPFKIEQTLLDENDRLELVKEAIADDQRMVASDVEFQLPKPSYTYVTLDHLRKNFSQHTFVVIMGSDSFRSLNNWKNFEEIVSQHQIIIYQRPGFDVTNKINAQMKVVDAPMLNISSTNIRELVSKGKSIRYLVPDSVRETIESNGFYKK